MTKATLAIKNPKLSVNNATTGLAEMTHSSVSIPSTHPAVATIVCLDDDAQVLRSIKRTLSFVDARIATFTNGEVALDFMRANTASVILCDMRMPHMSGAEFLAEARRLQPNAYRVLITGYSELNATIAAVNDGWINRYLSKPWDNNQLQAIVREGLRQFYLTESTWYQQAQINEKNNELEELVGIRTQQLRKAVNHLKQQSKNREKDYQGVINVLLNTLNVNPISTGHFNQNVATLAKVLANRVALPEQQVELIRLSGSLVNLGFLGIDPDILQKKPENRTSEEKVALSRHPKIAHLILSPATHLNALADILLHQNEAYDGSGKPFGLAGEAIPLGSRILTLSRDFWRAAHDGNSDQRQAYERGKHALIRGKGRRYDPLLVEYFCQLEVGDLGYKQKSTHHLTTAELEPGMVLSDNLFNVGGLLLLAKGSILTSDIIAKLEDYQAFRDEILFVPIRIVDEAVSSPSGPLPGNVG